MGYSYLIQTYQVWLIEFHSAIMKRHLNLLHLVTVLGELSTITKSFNSMLADNYFYAYPPL